MAPKVPLALLFGLLLGFISGLFFCGASQVVMAEDQNGPITRLEVSKAAQYLNLVPLAREEEWRLARELAIARELAKRAREHNLTQSALAKYLLHKYLPLRLKIQQVLNQQVEKAFSKGIKVIRSRSLVIKLGQKEGFFTFKQSKAKVAELYQRLANQDFSSLLAEFGQANDFQELPLAIFPLKLQTVLEQCPEKGTMVLPPVFLNEAWFLVQCDGWRWVLPATLAKLFPQIAPTIIAAEKERLRIAIARQYAVNQTLPPDWQKQTVLYFENKVVLTRQDFLEELTFEAWRRHTSLKLLLKNQSLLEEIFQEICQRLRIAASQESKLDEEWLAFESQALLARLMLWHLLDQKQLATNYQKVLDPLMPAFIETDKSIIREIENQILREIGFRFVTNITLR